MKNLIIFIVSTFIVLGAASCKKNNSTSTTTNNTTTTTTTTSTGNGTITCSLNGSAWTSTRNTAMLTIDNSNGISALVINGETSADIIAIGLDIPTASKNLSAGTHDYEGPKEDLLMQYTTKTSGGGTFTQHLPEAGGFTITSVDNTNKKFSANFSFTNVKVGAKTAADTIRGTNGVIKDVQFVIVEQQNLKIFTHR